MLNNLVIPQCKLKDEKTILEIFESNTGFLIFALISRYVQVLKTRVQKASFFSSPHLVHCFLPLVIY